MRPVSTSTRQDKHEKTKKNNGSQAPYQDAGFMIKPVKYYLGQGQRCRQEVKWYFIAATNANTDKDAGNNGKNILALFCMILQLDNKKQEKEDKGWQVGYRAWYPINKCCRLENSIGKSDQQYSGYPCLQSFAGFFLHELFCHKTGENVKDNP